ncbi:MAG: NAD(P)-dependent oxidoreductase [Clostridia bacterium]
MRVFVTGGTGFLGSHIVMQLLRDGHEVTVLARDLERVTGFKDLKGLTLVKGLITDFSRFPGWLEGQDCVIHTVLNWGESASDMLLNDTLTSVKLFEEAARAKVKQGIFTSSTMALGEYRHDMHEEMPNKPLDYYGAGKASTEAFLFGISRMTEMRCNIVRPGRIIGRKAVEGGKDWSFAPVKDFVEKAKRNEDICVVRNDGTQFIDGRDLAKIYLALLTADKNREIYFGVGKRFIDHEMIARKIVALTSSQSHIKIDENPYEDRPKMFDVSKIEKDFGFAFDTWDEIVEEMECLL